VKLKFILLGRMLSSILLSCVAAVAVASESFTVVWYDDFGFLNTSNWRVADNFTHGNQEWQLYLKEQVYVQNSMLVIETDVKPAISPTGKLYNFVSGWVDTANKVEFTYGLHEARIKLPKELSGVWPAYWLVDDIAHCWPVGGEIDILEQVGTFRNDSVFGTYHWGSSCGNDLWSKDGQRNGDYPKPVNGFFSDDFHTFSVYYNATAITWAVDGNPYVSRTVGDPASLFVLSWPLYLILNTAMSFWGSAQPPPQVGFPVFMYVDYVSFAVFDGPGSATGNFPIPYNATGLQPQ
jgi:beta-glucanase (GH16 family)